MCVGPANKKWIPPETSDVFLFLGISRKHKDGDYESIFTRCRIAARAGPIHAMSERVRSIPLRRAAKLLLMVSTSLTILGCYLFSILSIVVLLVVLLLELGLFVILLRFGLAGYLLRYIQGHFQLVLIFLRNLWLAKGVEYFVALRREEAQGLFAILDELSKHFAVKPPSEVRVEMNAGAWVRLHGFRKGAGRTVLGVGFDLLALLNVSEFEAVLAHEMAHAKLVERGLKSWLARGLGRISMLEKGLGECVEAYHAARQTFHLAEMLRKWANFMLALAARQVSAYSRQDEFEADHGAALFAGSRPLKTSLLRLETIEPKLGRLPWSERIGRSETEASFSGWLVEELRMDLPEDSQIDAEFAHDPYATHPSLPDRLAALPDAPGRTENTASAMGLLADPDRVATSLIEETLRIAAIQEEKDARQLAKSMKKSFKSVQLGWGHVPALILFAGGFFAAIGFCADMSNWWVLPLAILLFAGSYWALRLAKYRDKYSLPVPSYKELKKAWKAGPPADVKEKEDAIVEEFKTLKRKDPRKPVALGELIEEAFAALGECDYLRAHVASRIALQSDGRSVEAALGNAIASAALGMSEQAGRLLGFVHARTACSSPETVWGAAWACVLSGDWVNAEALLSRKHREKPDEATFVLLLALVQKIRGKLQSAVRNAEKGLALCPGEKEAAKLLAECLLDTGRPKAAAEQLLALEADAKKDPEVAMAMVRLRVLQRDIAAAREFGDHLCAIEDIPTSLIRLGNVLESARHDDLAFSYYLKVLDHGHYPEAHLGLGRILSRRKEVIGARQSLLSALNMETVAGSKSCGSLPLFDSVLAELMQVGRGREQCRAWMATFKTEQVRMTPEAFRGCRILVFARSRDLAEEYLEEIIKAVQPVSQLPAVSDLSWSDAPKNMQPVRPVFPGVQMALANG